MIRIVVETDTDEEATELLAALARVRVRAHLRDYASRRRHLHSVPERKEA